MATKPEEESGEDKLVIARNNNLDLAVQQSSIEVGDDTIMRR